MPIKKDREYRNLGTFKMELDDSEDSYVVGYASTFDAYPMYEEDGITYYERIDRHAFDDADMSDVVFLRDHSGRVLARTKNGSVELSVDDHGLYQKTNLGLTDAAKDMLEDIAVGNYSQMSFSFVVDKDHYERETHTRVLDKIRKIYDISAVSFPANPFTDIGISMRDYFHGEMEKVEAERLEAEKRAKARKALQLRIKMMKGKNDGSC